MLKSKLKENITLMWVTEWRKTSDNQTKWVKLHKRESLEADTNLLCSLFDKFVIKVVPNINIAQKTSFQCTHTSGKRRLGLLKLACLYTHRLQFVIRKPKKSWKPLELNLFNSLYHHDLHEQSKRQKKLFRIIYWNFLSLNQKPDMIIYYLYKVKIVYLPTYLLPMCKVEL